ncbi:COG4705 family protein [Dactylosporangium sp. CA-139066]|uniref:COG4705 family protein n=1 Tax=Dactylosporangium sp. CA-139066 TaxID=3239930 RepID=UPI003D92D157
MLLRGRAVSVTANELASSRRWLTKVPAITATFWVIKVLSTTIGETFADYLTVNAGLGPAVTDAIMFALLVAALVVQFRTRSYTPWIYWLCVVLVSIFGTQLTDFFTDTLGVSLYVSTAVFSVTLAVVFAIWYRQERTLAIASINTPRREGFYWAAILTTFALGTAAGDLATEALNLGFRNGALIFGGLILATWIANRLGAGQVLTFWIAYVLTRPLGASLGDLLTQDKDLGGLALGASATSLLFLAAIVVLVVREQMLVSRHGVLDKGAGPHGGRVPDYAWAGAAAVAVAVIGFGLSLAHGSQPATDPQADVAPDTVATGEPGASTAARQPHPTTKLGNLSKFAVIVADVQGKVAKNDLAAARTRVKDLEVAWDDAEAGLKPRDAAKWHQLDDQIDAVLTALRASQPAQPDCASAVAKLMNTLNTYDGV